MTPVRWILLVLAISDVGVTAQDFNSSLKAARAALTRFQAQTLDPADLRDAHSALLRTFVWSEAQTSYDAWQLKGEINHAIATQWNLYRSTGIGNKASLPQVDNPALDAWMALQKASQMAQKQADAAVTDRIMQALQTNFNGFGLTLFEEGNYKEAYHTFKACLDAHEWLRKAGNTSALDKVAAYNDQIYLIGMAAYQAGMTADAKTYLTRLYESQYQQPQLYEMLYQIISAEQGPVAAYTILDRGRALFPDDTSLLFADINHAIATQQLDQLVSMLEAAIAKEPDNLVLYTMLANVYDQHFQQSMKAGDKVKADTYFRKGIEYLEMVLQKDERSFDAAYGLAAMLYNKAAMLTQELNLLPEDFSEAGVQRFQTFRNEINAHFDAALPYFQKAESKDPNDLNTLIALKEIYARKGDDVLFMEFRNRSDRIRSGGRNDKSYFSW